MATKTKEVEAPAESTALATKEQEQAAALALREAFGELDEDIQSAIMDAGSGVRPLIPFATIRQKDGKDANGEIVRAGGFKFNDGRPDVALPADVYLVMPTDGRTYWGGDDNQVPVCRSDDGLTPSPMAQAPQADHCLTCPRAQWPSAAEREDGKTRPDCGQVRNVLCVLADAAMDSESIFVFSAHGTALKPLAKYLSILKRKYAKLGFFAVVTRIGSDITEEGSYTWYAPTFQSVGMAEPEVYTFLATQLRDLRDAMRKSVAETVVEREESAAASNDNFADWQGDNDAPQTAAPAPAPTADERPVTEAEYDELLVSAAAMVTAGIWTVVPAIPEFADITRADYRETTDCIRDGMHKAEYPKQQRFKAAVTAATK